MPISFSEITATRVPGQRVEIDSSRAVQGASALPYRCLLIGPATDAGTETATKSLITITDPDQVGAKYGFGSALHQMAEAFYRSAAGTEFAVMASAREAIATATNKATVTLTVTASGAKSGTIYLYIGGQRVTVAVTAADSATTIATSIKNAITPASGSSEYPDLFVTAAVVDSVVTLAAKNVGTFANELDVRCNYYAGEAFPSGVSVAVGSVSGGSGDPDISSGSPSLIDNMGDEWYQAIVCAYNDTANLSALHTELERRFGAMLSIDGVLFVAKSDTVTNLVTRYDVSSNGENSKHFSVMGATSVPTTPWEFAASVAGKVCAHLRTGNGAESLPFQTGACTGVLPPAESDRLIESEQDLLLNSGVSTFQVNGGRVLIQRLVTNYQQNASGAPDTSWLDVNTRFTAMYLRYDWITYLSIKYPQAKLTDDGTRIAPGQKVMTPSIAKSEAIARFRVWEELGLVEGFEQFKADLIAERNSADVNRMDWMISPNFVNQFRVGATRMSFVL